MTGKLIAATAVLLLALVVPSAGLAHTQPPPPKPKPRCLITTDKGSASRPCFAVRRLGTTVDFA